MIINKKAYTVIRRDSVGDDSERVTLVTTGGIWKTAMFYKGQFDSWETKPRSHSKYRRVNMRS